MKQHRYVFVGDDGLANESAHPDLMPLSRMHGLQTMRKVLADIDLNIARTVYFNAQAELERMQNEFAQSAAKVTAQRQQEGLKRMKEVWTCKVLMHSFQLERRWLKDLNFQQSLVEDHARTVVDAEQQYLEQLKRRKFVELRLFKLGEVTNELTNGE